MSDNLMIFSRNVKDYFNKLNSNISKLNARAIPFVVEPTINGEHRIGLTAISTGGRMTMTNGSATIVRRGEMRDLDTSIKRSIYNAKVSLYLTEHNDPIALSRKMELLKHMQNQDYLRIIMRNEAGLSPLPDGKGTNLRGGLLNYAGSVTLAGEVKSVEDLINFVADATSNIDDLVDMSVDETEVGQFTKRFSLLVPSKSGAERATSNTGNGYETLREHLLRFYQTDLVSIPSSLIPMDKVVLIPATQHYIYFHLDTFNEIYDWKPGDGKFDYEIHWATAGPVVANGQLIQTKKIKTGKLEGLIERHQRIKTEIINDPLKIKQEEAVADQGTQQRQAQATPKPAGPNVNR